MLCLVALIIFSVLGIFSLSYRQLAKEALDCVFRRMTFRSCNTGFQEKVRAKVSGGLLKYSVFLAKVFNKYFELLAWIFFILMIASTAYTIYGGYNFLRYGSCNGLNSSGFCVFDPAGSNNQISQAGASCSAGGPQALNLNLTNVNLDDFPRQKIDSKNQVVFIGCYLCDYTRATYPVIKELLQNHSSDYTFIHFPVKSGSEYLSNYAYCAYKQDPQKFWSFNDSLFSSKKEDLINNDYVLSLAVKAGYDENSIEKCAVDQNTHSAVNKLFDEVATTNIYGTPTIFVNGQPFVGPKPYRVYWWALK